MQKERSDGIGVLTSPMVLGSDVLGTTVLGATANTAAATASDALTTPSAFRSAAANSSLLPPDDNDPNVTHMQLT